MNSTNKLPLEGVVVIDLGQVYQGPYAGFLMAQAGATVIKVEPPNGEPVRHRARISKGNAVPFAMLNANKRNISLNLKSPEGVKVLKELAAKADVLIENYAPGVLDRLGIGYSVLSAINPRLVYGSATGYGLSGPDRDNLAMDLTVQAVSGIMSVTGFADGPPVKAGPAITDFISGVHLYAGILTALYDREKSGRGRLVEIAMVETVYPAMASNLADVFNRKAAAPRTGNRHGGLAEAPYNVYPASDGYVAIISVNESHWTGFGKRFFDKVGRMPTMVQAGMYSATLHYLKAVEAAGTLDTAAVLARFRSLPVNDFFSEKGYVREDGMHIHDYYLLRAKTVEQSKGPWDFYDVVATVPADDANIPRDQSKCALMKKS